MGNWLAPTFGSPVEPRTAGCQTQPAPRHSPSTAGVGGGQTEGGVQSGGLSPQLRLQDFQQGRSGVTLLGKEVGVGASTARGRSQGNVKCTLRAGRVRGRGRGASPAPWHHPELLQGQNHPEMERVSFLCSCTSLAGGNRGFCQMSSMWVVHGWGFLESGACLH